MATDELSEQQIQDKRDVLAERVRTGGVLTPTEITWLQDLNIKEEYTVPSPVEKVRKRPYNMSPAALKQRQKNSAHIAEDGLATGPTTEEGKAHSSQNARTHGLYAQTFIDSPFFKTCKTTCPSYPCSMVDDDSTSPGEQCMDRQHFLDTVAAIHQAITDKRPEAFNALIETELAASLSLFRDLMENIGSQGLMLESREPGKNGAILKLKVHPAVKPATELLKQLGISFPEFMATPKSIDTAKTNRTIAASMLDKQGRAGSKLGEAQSFASGDEEEDSA